MVGEDLTIMKEVLGMATLTSNSVRLCTLMGVPFFFSMK